MTISNANNNLASLVSRIEQLEAQQEIWKKNTIWLKRCFDELKQEFNKLAELSQVDTQEKILQLSAQVVELQQHFDKVPYVTDSLDSVRDKSAVEKANLRKELLLKKHNQFTQNKLGVSLYAKGISGEEFWKRYENGDRNFVGINLTGADLTAIYSRIFFLVSSTSSLSDTNSTAKSGHKGKYFFLCCAVKFIPSFHFYPGSIRGTSCTIWKFKTCRRIKSFS